MWAEAIERALIWFEVIVGAALVAAAIYVFTEYGPYLF